jgi:hypothetical protein
MRSGEIEPTQFQLACEAISRVEELLAQLLRITKRINSLSILGKKALRTLTTMISPVSSRDLARPRIQYGEQAELLTIRALAKSLEILLERLEVVLDVLELIVIDSPPLLHLLVRISNPLIQRLHPVKRISLPQEQVEERRRVRERQGGRCSLVVTV